jgi:hypothetical protein
MKEEPVDEHAVRDAPPTETEKKVGVVSAGVVALVVVGMAIYWIS